MFRRKAWRRTRGLRMPIGWTRSLALTGSGCSAATQDEELRSAGAARLYNQHTENDSYGPRMSAQDSSQIGIG
jgi:hypothetical protein